MKNGFFLITGTSRGIGEALAQKLLEKGNTVLGVADKVIDAVSLGFMNRILGIVFGLIKNILILSVVFSVLNAIDARKPFINKSKISQSKLYNPISDIVPAIFPILGEGNFIQSFDRFKKNTEPVRDSGEITI